MILPPTSMQRLTGFGQALAGDCYVVHPKHPEDLMAAFELARRSGRQLALRGAGKSYGDANFAAEALVADLSRMNRILQWDAWTGLVHAEGGATLEDIWRITLPDGWWLPVVSGTTKVTLGGALAMNIHGKNAFAAGTLGEHIDSITVATPSGMITLGPTDPDFANVISSAGLLGAIVSATLRMKRVQTGGVRVEAVSCANWSEQFAAFEEDAEYKVSWVDGFSAGRGLFHRAWHADEDEFSQELPTKILGLLPKNQVWRILRILNHRSFMKGLNAAKHWAGRREHGKRNKQSLAAFNFLLDYVPDWEHSYLPGGLIQCQYFVPKDQSRVFERLFELQQRKGLETFLAVLKRHRPDHIPFLFGHSLDGYSLAMDFKVTEANRASLWELAETMMDEVVRAGGRTYFAKDATLTPSQLQASLGETTLARFREAKSRFDPAGILTSDLARRLNLG